MRLAPTTSTHATINKSNPHPKKQLKATRYRIALSFIFQLEERVKAANPHRSPQRKKGFQPFD
jgi:methionine-rich copper-binding protein CopC